MLSGRITIGVENLKKVSKDVGKLVHVSTYALAAAIKRTTAFARTQIAKSIREKYEIRAGTIRSKTSIRQQATPARPMAVLQVKDATQSIYPNFKVSPRLRRKKSYRVSVTIKKGSPRVIRGGAFLPKGSSTKQKQQIWMRQGKARLPVVALHTLSVAQMVNDEVGQEIHVKIGEELKKRLAHELEFRMKKLKESGKSEGG